MPLQKVFTKFVPVAGRLRAGSSENPAGCLFSFCGFSVWALVFLFDPEHQDQDLGLPEKDMGASEPSFGGPWGFLAPASLKLAMGLASRYCVELKDAAHEIQGLGAKRIESKSLGGKWIDPAISHGHARTAEMNSLVSVFEEIPCWC